MDSPDTSLYQPVSLSDTLTQASKRSYRSAGATLTASTSTARLAGPRASVLPTPQAQRSRSDVARREAAAMCESLGFSGGSSAGSEVDATPRPSGGRSLNSTGAATTARTAREGSPVEVISLKSNLEDKDNEIASLRRELAAALRDKKELASQVRHHGKQPQTGSAKGLDVKEMEELERAFAEQEKLLGGYQREVEKQAEEIDRLKSRSRRMADCLERIYGPSYEDELGLADRSKNSATSPAVRQKLVARASLATGFGSLSRATTVPTSLAACAELPESPRSADPSSPIAGPDVGETGDFSATGASNIVQAGGPSIAPAALAQHLDSVQALLRSMEARLISRDVELAAIEQRAKQERIQAREKQEELETLVAESRKACQGQE